MLAIAEYVGITLGAVVVVIGSLHYNRRFTCIINLLYYDCSLRVYSCTTLSSVGSMYVDIMVR
jgi:hypothetical protein